MHTSEEDTDSKNDPNLLDTGKDNESHTNQDTGSHGSTEQQYNVNTLQENVKDQKGKVLHTSLPYEAIGNPSVGLANEPETDLYAELPILLTDSLDTDIDDTGYDEIRHTPDAWIEDNLIHNTEVDKFIQAAIGALAPQDSPTNLSLIHI